MTILIQYELIDYDEEKEHEFDCAPCPFCGSETLEFVTDTYGFATCYAVQCHACDARGPACREYARAAELWNAVERKFSKQTKENSDVRR